MIVIEVSIAEQRLRLIQNGKRIKEYIVSTAANGVGFAEGSYCTPTGMFEISEKIGAGEVTGTVFKARQPVSVWDGEPSDHDLVLTRIIRLNGLDPDNANTMERYIYIHGTNQDELLGSPASCGCIRMGNDDVIDLFDLTELGQRIEIFD